MVKFGNIKNTLFPLIVIVASPLQMWWFFFGRVTLFKVLPHKLVCVCLYLSYCLFQVCGNIFTTTKLFIHVVIQWKPYHSPTGGLIG